MSKNLYVGNLPYTVEKEELKSIFEGFGAICSVNVIMDRETGRSKGFGFVNYEDEDSGKEASEKLNGYEVKGRNLIVKEAHSGPRQSSRY